MTNLASKPVWKTAITIAALGCCATAKSTQESSSFSREGQRIDDLRKKCDFGHFLNLASHVCDSCDKHCKNGTEMESCGFECRVYYFVKKDLDEVIEVQATRIDKLEELTKKLQTEIDRHNQLNWVQFFVAIVLSIGIATIIMLARVKKLTPPNRPIQCEDRHNARYVPCPENAAYNQPDQANLQEETPGNNSKEDRRVEVLIDQIHDQPEGMC